MARKKKNEGAQKAPVSMDQEIGKGLTPKTPYQEHMGQWESKAEKKKPESSQIEKDYEMHPKFSKFKGEG